MQKEDKVKNLGSLKRLHPRKIWPNESQDFTPWLADNIEGLGKVLGLELELVRRESPVGDFSLDILARDIGSKGVAVLENQLERTDHDHLGKLITYAAGNDASFVIWISQELREEHRQALDWMNQRTDEDTSFFGIVLEVLQIDDSLPAYNFKVAVAPNEWRRTIKSGPKTKTTERGEAYRSWFQILIDVLREQHQFTGARKGQPQSWYLFSTGVSGVYYGASFTLGKKFRVEVYLDRPEQAENKELFDYLHDMKGHLQESFGNDLEWERLDDKKGSRIAFYRNGCIVDDDYTLNDIRNWAIQHLLKLREAFQNTLSAYP